MCGPFLWPTQTSVQQVVWAFFPRGKADRVWSADARLHPVLSLAMTGTVLLLPLHASMAGAGTSLPLCARY